MKSRTERGRLQDSDFSILKLFSLFALSTAIVAFVATVALERSLEIGKLSIPPYYDDVVYLFCSQLVLHAAPQQSFFTTLYQIVDQHSPLTTLFGVLGYSLIKSGDIGPYIVGAGHVIFFIFGCALLIWRLPALAIVGFASAIGAIPMLRHFVTEFRPEPAWATLTALSAIAFFALDIFAFSWRKLVGLGLLVGFAVISKPTTSPVTLFVLGTAFLASGLVQYYERRSVGSPPTFRTLITSAAIIWTTALIVIIPTGAIIGHEIYDYFVWVMRDVTSQVEHRGGFADQLLFYSFGYGGQPMLGQALPTCLAIWGIGIGYAALWQRSALPRILALFVVVLISYAIPTISVVKLVWFGSAFDAILIIATVYLIALLYEPFAGSPSYPAVRVAISALVCVTGIGLLFTSNLSEQPSGLLGMDVVARDDMKDRTARIWAVLRERELARLSSNPSEHLSHVMTVAIEPIVGTVISLYGVKENLPIRGAEFPYARSLDEVLTKLPDVDFVVAGPSYEHILSGAKLGDALRDAMDARSDFSRIATLPLRNPGAVVHIYERKSLYPAGG